MTADTKLDTSADGLADPGMQLGESDLRLYWEVHVLTSPKGRTLPSAIFSLGALTDEVLELLEAKDSTWQTVENRVFLRSEAMVHWDMPRRQALCRMLDTIGSAIRSATEVSLGNGQHGWLQPVLITQAAGGLTVPIAIMAAREGIEVKSLITPVSAHRIKELRKRQ